MDYEQFRRHLGKAGLTINEFASILDIKPSTVSNYSQRREVPRAYATLAILLGHAGDNNVDFRAVLARFGIVMAEGDRRKIAHMEEYRAGSKRPPK